MVGLHLFPEPTPGITPQLIASNSILQLSTVELEQAILRELDANPALEMIEQPTCPVCGGKLSTGVCVRCSGIEAITPLSPSSSDSHFSEADWGAQDSQEEVDPLNLVAVPLTLPELLFEQLQLALPEKDHIVALNVIGNLDERGYLTITSEKIAELLNIEKMCVEAVVKELQSLDPAGIGAGTVEECLLLQLERLIEQGATPPSITRTVINRYLPQLGHHQFEHICSALNVSRIEVEEAFLFIRSNLHPYPAHHYFAANEHSFTNRELLIPSVLIHRNAAAASDYEIEVIESQRFFLRFNPAYQRLQHHPELTFSPGEREHVTHFLDRARLFMRQLQRRSLLLHKLMLFLVNYQRDFLDHGLTHLRPLSQKIAAQEIGVHVSTISRAIANKYAQLPSRELIPLHLFFSAELRVQQVIRQIIANEKECLSDAAIARLLSEQHGVTLSRQMVANYRIDLGIPAARQRAILRKQGGPHERSVSKPKGAYSPRRSARFETSGPL